MMLREGQAALVDLFVNTKTKDRLMRARGPQSDPPVWYKCEKVDDKYARTLEGKFESDYPERFKVAQHSLDDIARMA